MIRRNRLIHRIRSSHWIQSFRLYPMIRKFQMTHLNPSFQSRSIRMSPRSRLSPSYPMNLTNRLNRNSQMNPKVWNLIRWIPMIQCHLIGPMFHWILTSPTILMIPMIQSCRRIRLNPRNLMIPSYHSIPSYPMSRSNQMIHCYLMNHWIQSIRWSLSSRLSRRIRSFRWIQVFLIQMIHCFRSIPWCHLNPKNLTSHLSSPIQRSLMSPTNRYCRMIRLRIPHNRRLHKSAAR